MTWKNFLDSAMTEEVQNELQEFFAHAYIKRSEHNLRKALTLSGEFEPFVNAVSAALGSKVSRTYAIGICSNDSLAALNGKKMCFVDGELPLRDNTIRLIEGEPFAITQNGKLKYTTELPYLIVLSKKIVKPNVYVMTVNFKKGANIDINPHDVSDWIAQGLQKIKKQKLWNTKKNKADLDSL